MKSIIAMFKEPNATKIVEIQTDQARRLHLEHAAMAEHHAAMAEMYRKRVERLKVQRVVTAQSAA